MRREALSCKVFYPDCLSPYLSLITFGLMFFRFRNLCRCHPIWRKGCCSDSIVQREIWQPACLKKQKRTLLKLLTDQLRMISKRMTGKILLRSWGSRSWTELQQVRKLVFLNLRQEQHFLIQLKFLLRALLQIFQLRQNSGAVVTASTESEKILRLVFPGSRMVRPPCRQRKFLLTIGLHSWTEPAVLFRIPVSLMWQEPCVHCPVGYRNSRQLPAPGHWWRSCPGLRYFCQWLCWFLPDGQLLERSFCHLSCG